MSTTLFTAAHAFRASGAVLHERSAAGCPVARAEMARRAGGKGGYVRRVLRARASGSDASSAAPAILHTRFARAEAKLPKRDTLKAVRGELDARLNRVEKTLGEVTSALAKTHAAVALLSQQVSGRLAA